MLRYAQGMVALVVGALLLQGCGADADPFEDADPRCAAACAIEAPPIEGALDICSRESAGECVEQCEVRIESVAPLCATCLLERAQFNVESDGGPFSWCDGMTCWLENASGQQCQYPQDDEPAAEECIRQLYPRREVACSVRWRPVTECGEICG